MACCRTLVLGLRDFGFCFFSVRDPYELSSCVVFLPAHVGLLSFDEKLCIFPLGAQHDPVWTSLYWGTYNYWWKILSLFIYDSFTLEVSSLSRWFTLHALSSLVIIFLPLQVMLWETPIPPSVSVLWLVSHSCSSALSLAIGGLSCTVPSAQEVDISGWWPRQKK